jgi:ubiquitin-conjugating enzyme E2 Q
MAACDSNAELQSLLDDRSPLVAPLLRWLLFSNPAVVRPLRPAERFEAVPTPHQFVLLTAGPGKESEWRALRDEAERKMGRGRGSVYMFHGSPLHNWHSILRTGLQVRGLPGLGASGAAIWMANEMTTSVGYSLKARSTVWDASVFPRDAMCMGLLEVVHDRAKDVSPEKDVCVVPDVRLIMTRFFFILSARECSRCHGQGRAALPRAERLPKRSFDSL